MAVAEAPDCAVGPHHRGGWLRGIRRVLAGEGSEQTSRGEDQRSDLWLAVKRKPKETTILGGPLKKGMHSWIGLDSDSRH